ncbi:hypothetical protein BKA69DRAFT_1035305 [Paraphysoderma sedebokerense]|nr:hypothetical protein BKA69DRAFT_1035305 [Paraphysoderma sedebokerense]
MPKTSARQARINSLTEQYEETLSSIYRSKRLVFKLMAMYLALEDNWDEMLDVFGILAGFPTTISGNPLSDEMKLLLSYYKGHKPLLLLLPESGLSEEEQAFLVFRNHWNDSSVKRELERQLQNTLSQRYLTPRIRKHDRPRGRLEDILSKYTDDQFKQEVRMSKSNFTV